MRTRPTGAARRAALDEMVRISEELGLYELAAEPVQIRRLAEMEDG